MQQSFNNTFAHQDASKKQAEKAASKFQTKRKLILVDEYLKEAKDTFVKDAVFLESREQFEDYMRVMENQFYETVSLPKSPYVDAKRQEGHLLQQYPPQAFGFGQSEPPVERGKKINYISMT